MGDDDSSRKIRRCGQIGEGEDDEVSMQDVLDEHVRLQADASAVLGASDPSNCTFPKGYLKRQAIYACATCTPHGNAGICLACSYACHEGHDLYELYTKRYFCCDCGNDKFSGQECKLVKDKKLNSRNRYNQNFKGLYCSCSRPYPDPEDTEEDEMIQCMVCEDWYHGRHLKTAVPEDDFFEMTCPECMSKLPFLWAYNAASQSDVAIKKENPEENKEIDVGTSIPTSSCKATNDENHNVNEQSVSSGKSENTCTDSVSVSVDGACSKEKENTDVCAPSSSKEQDGAKRKRERDTSDEEVPHAAKLPKREEETKTDDDTGEGDATKENCLLRNLQERQFDAPEHAVFWTEGWREKLCKCKECLEMYQDRGVEFLVEEADTVHAYEEAGEGEEALNENEEEDLFSGMHRIQQIEIARGVRDLKTDLSEFLLGFAREGKVVTESDVREFFQSLEEKRRRRMNLPPDNCR